MVAYENSSDGDGGIIKICEQVVHEIQQFHFHGPVCIIICCNSEFEYIKLRAELVGSVPFSPPLHNIAELTISSARIFMRNLSGKDMNRRQEMLKKLSSKVNQMATTLNMSTSADRESLLGLDKKPDAMSRAVGLDSHGLVGLQQQDEDLDKLEETVTSTKHIALAVNEELTLHARLLDDLDQHVDSTNSRLQRVQKRLAILNKGTKGGCSCLILLVIVIVILIVVIWAIIKYL
ncbi:Target SNARE coiled-coil homology domain [Dillenia turbinata]|uniref:Target SNARE coiled-coil homology domain n=1 Tax=Dillenia turbinata TaxID=194707 RepID=A0AAN8VRL3_9MAGN